MEKKKALKTLDEIQFSICGKIRLETQSLVLSRQKPNTTLLKLYKNSVIFSASSQSLLLHSVTLVWDHDLNSYPDLVPLLPLPKTIRAYWLSLLLNKIFYPCRKITNLFINTNLLRDLMKLLMREYPWRIWRITLYWVGVTLICDNVWILSQVLKRIWISFVSRQRQRVALRLTDLPSLALFFFLLWRSPAPGFSKDG